jgi:hypothetical protein
MCVVPRSDDLLVLQSLIQASSHGDAAVYPRALSAATAAAPASTASTAAVAAAMPTVTITSATIITTLAAALAPTQLLEGGEARGHARAAAPV